MNNHPFYERHIGINEQDEARMLRKIGVGSLDELIDKTLPANIRLKAPLDLPEAMDEHEFAQHIGRLSAGWPPKTNSTPRTSDKAGTAPSPPPSSNATSSRTPYGTPPTRPTRRKCRKDAWRP